MKPENAVVVVDVAAPIIILATLGQEILGHHERVGSAIGQTAKPHHSRITARPVDMIEGRESRGLRILSIPGVAPVHDIVAARPLIV